MANFPLAFGLSRAYFSDLWPLMPAARCSRFDGPFTAAFSQRGIVSDWPFAGKRKVYEASAGHAHYTNSFSTSPKIVQFIRAQCLCPFIFAEKRKFAKFSHAEKFPVKYCRIIRACGKRKFEQKFILCSTRFGPVEFVDSNRIAADDQAIL